LETAISNYITGTVSATKGDYFYILAHPVNTPTAVEAYVSMVFNSTTAKQSGLFGFLGGNLATDGTSQYISLSNAGFGTTLNQWQIVIPCSGKLKNLYVRLSNTTGGAAGDGFLQSLKGPPQQIQQKRPLLTMFLLIKIQLMKIT
jgi:hypothetical protein